MTRLHVFQIRLVASLALLLLIFGVVRLLWYPGAYFAISGVVKQFVVLAGVVLVVGPVLTTFLYKPGKKGLTGDLVIVTAIEIIAVVAAVWVMFQRQPYFTVFAVDRFEAIALANVSGDAAELSRFGGRPGHTPRLIFAALPEDTERMQRLIDETVFEGKADIDRRPEFWHHYATGIVQIKAAAKPLSALLSGDAQRTAEVQRWLAGTGSAPEDFIYLPLRGTSGDATIVLHADIGYPVATLNIDPW